MGNRPRGDQETGVIRNTQWPLTAPPLQPPATLAAAPSQQQSRCYRHSSTATRYRHADCAELSRKTFLALVLQLQATAAAITSAVSGNVRATNQCAAQFGLISEG